MFPSDSLIEKLKVAESRPNSDGYLALSSINKTYFVSETENEEGTTEYLDISTNGE